MQDLDKDRNHVPIVKKESYLNRKCEDGVMSLDSYTNSNESILILAQSRKVHKYNTSTSKLSFTYSANKSSMSGNKQDGYLGTMLQLLLQQQLLLQVMLLQSLHPTLLVLVPMLELLPILAIVERLLTILDLLPILDLPRITRKGLIGFEIVL